MAEGRWKITLGLRLNSTGATESYISALLPDTAMTARLDSLIGQRLLLMHNSVKVTGLRVAQVTDELGNPIKRRSRFFRPGRCYPFVAQDPDGNGGVLYILPSQGSDNTDAYKPDLDRTSLVYRVLYSGGRAANRYLFGFPDDALYGENPTVRLGAVPQLDIRFGLFRAKLIGGGWSIRARGVTGDFTIRDIQGWSQAGSTPSLVGVNTAVVTAALYPVGSSVQISGSRRRGTDRVSYNGRYIVASIIPSSAGAPGTVWLAATEAGDASSIKLPGTIQKRGYVYDPITGLETVMGGSHKRGKPLGTPRGNRKSRVLLDP